MKPAFCKVCGHLAPGCKAYETYDRIGWTKVICQCPKSERPIANENQDLAWSDIAL